LLTDRRSKQRLIDFLWYYSLIIGSAEVPNMNKKRSNDNELKIIGRANTMLEYLMRDPELATMTLATLCEKFEHAMNYENGTVKARPSLVLISKDGEILDP
jgi:hypothetical protein